MRRLYQGEQYYADVQKGGNALVFQDKRKLEEAVAFKYALSSLRKLKNFCLDCGRKCAGVRCRNCSDKKAVSYWTTEKRRNMILINLRWREKKEGD